MAGKTNTELTEMIVSSKTLEGLLGVKDRTIRDLADKGIVKRDSHGRYLLWESAKGYIAALKAVSAGKSMKNVDDTEDCLDLDNERAMHEHTKRQITEIKLQLIKGQVHKAEDVQKVMTDMFAKFKSKMTAMPSKLARKLEDKKRTDIQKILKEEIDEALAELADYNPSDFYSDEHIDLPDDAVASLGVTDE